MGEKESTERESIVFYKSFFEVIRGMMLPDGTPAYERQARAYSMLLRYGYYGDLPDEADFMTDGKPDETLRALFIIARPLMDTARKKYSAGKRGGRPLKKDPPAASHQWADAAPPTTVYIPPDVRAQLEGR